MINYVMCVWLGQTGRITPRGHWIAAHVSTCGFVDTDSPYTAERSLKDRSHNIAERTSESPYLLILTLHMLKSLLTLLS